MKAKLNNETYPFVVIEDLAAMDKGIIVRSKEMHQKFANASWSRLKLSRNTIQRIYPSRPPSIWMNYKSNDI